MRTTAAAAPPERAPAGRPARTGLFGYEELREARGFRRMVRDAIAKSEGLIEDVRTTQPSVEVVRKLDNISNTVCLVLDAAELCRNVHSDREYVEEADKAFMELSQYVQKLNTSKVLYNALISSISTLSPSSEAFRVATMLQLDFERGGIDLPETTMERVDKLQTTILSLGGIFNANIVADCGQVDVFPASKLRALPESIKAMLRTSVGDAVRQKGGLCVPTDPVVVPAILKWVADPEVRKQVYMAGHSAPRSNLRILDDLINARHELAQVRAFSHYLTIKLHVYFAEHSITCSSQDHTETDKSLCLQLLGYESYAAYQVAPLMARTSKAVLDFLHELSLQSRQRADQELQALAKYRPENGDNVLRAWDRPYYIGLAKSHAHNLDSRVVAGYFPLESCIKGLGVLLESLFGINLQEEGMQPGEGWAPTVRKLTLRHPDEGPLGVVYLDLHPRNTKFSHSAHFTLRCGHGAWTSQRQLPVLALVCNFPQSSQQTPTLLNHMEVDTLFHEFGHALHTLLSDTEFQHLSGTRGVLDFVETPSNLIELYAWDYTFLCRFARHYLTDEVIPENMVTNLRSSKAMFAANDLQSQVLYALVDQELFGPQPLRANSTTAVLVELQKQHTNLTHEEGTHWQTRFSHLVGYAGGYYSYLYARCFASQIWQRHLAGKSLDREAGEMLRTALFRHGGAKDPVEVVKVLLGDDGIISTEDGGIRPCMRQALLEAGI
eukprot:SM000086S23008  [mRNA]  locus=s86:76943:81851:+ [translate_table: standard]